MNYYFSKTFFNVKFDEAIEKVTEELKKEGFDILSDIDVQATLKKKLDVNFMKYRILGACNPPFAYEALQSEINKMKKMRLFVMVAIAFFAISTLSAQQSGDYYFSKIVNGTFEDVTAKTKAELKKQGFGVITEIDMDAKLKEKLDDVDLRPYKILGVCSPSYAWQTIQVEENIGLFLPCKVLVKDLGEGKIEVVMVDPAVLMGMLGKEDLVKIADEVSKKFRKALKNI